VFTFVDSVPEVLLRPYISGRNLHVGLVLFAYIFGPLLFGWYGLFLGPLIVVLVVEFARVILPELVRGESLTPQPSAMPPDELDPPEGHDPDADDEALPPESTEEDAVEGDDAPPERSSDGTADRQSGDTSDDAPPDRASDEAPTD
jgi:hypothetical protein